MSISNPSSARTSASPAATAPRSEAAYLKQQAAHAKSALTKTLGEIGSGLGKGVSPAAWAKEHPWMTVSSAVVAGFVAATIAVPSKKQAALRRLAAIERALNEPSDKHHESNGHGKSSGGLLGVIISQLIRGAASIVTGMLVQKPNPEPEPADPATGHAESD
jgi:hypothetical protein